MVGNFKTFIAGSVRSTPCRRPGIYTGLVFLLLSALTLNAALQFDVFLGYDGVVPEASWFPVVCEIKNDGPPFKAMVEVAPGSAGYNQGQTRRMPVELPTGTLKRLTIPVFSTTRGYTSWDIRLIDDRGKVRAEKTGERPIRQLPAGSPLVGAIMRNVGSKPIIRPLPSENELQQPPSAAILPAILPDNPLVLEGMSALYLSSMRAPELRDPEQVQALYAWLNAGGHLIVGVEQLSDINSVKWLNALFPIELRDIKPVTRHAELEAWIRSTGWMTNGPQPAYPQYNVRPRPQKRPGRPPTVVVPQPEQPAPTPSAELMDDSKFQDQSLEVAVGNLRDGKVILSAQNTPLIVTAPRGRGRITALLFSPEREPFVSWKNLPTFWSKVTDIPADWYVSQRMGSPGGWSSDSIFGAMIDSRQVHKLPVEWLLVLLIVYLIVIGPLDRYWLKKINRPMLTWITFPCYVVAFSLLIYFIGYKLRAGEAEWTELHIVDVLRNGDKAELRGRTYASVYSPSNQRYFLESGQKYATLRGEFLGIQGGGQSSEKATVIQNGDSFRAEIFVPVWTSQLFVSDWWESSDVPVTATVSRKGNAWLVNVENHTEQKVTDVQIVIDKLVYRLADIPASQTKSFQLTSNQGMELRQFVSSHGHGFQNAVQQRQNAFGGTESGRIEDLQNSSVAVSFISQLDQHENYMGSFLTPPGLDLSAEADRGAAILFAWAENYSPVKPLYQIPPKRAHKNTLFRIPITPT
jgi:hypothetical protein